MNKLQDKLNVIRNKSRPYIKAIWNRLSPCIVKIGQYFQNNISTQQDRFKLYVLMVGLGVILCVLYNLILWLLTDMTLYGKGNTIFASTLAIFLLSLPAVTFNWWLKNHDQLQQFEYTKQQQDNTFKQIKLTEQQQAETIFNNAVQSLGQNDILTKSFGLKELMRLYQTTDQELDNRINLITASGLQLQGAKLQGADLERAQMEGMNLQEAELQQAELQGADLQRANLQGANLSLARLQRAFLREANLQGADLLGADLREADLREANLQGVRNLDKAILQGAIYNDETTFPKDFDPAAEEQGMFHENDLPKET